MAEDNNLTSSKFCLHRIHAPYLSLRILGPYMPKAPRPKPGLSWNLSLQDSPPPTPKRIRRHCKCMMRVDCVANRYPQYSDPPSITHAQHRLAGIRAITSLSSFRSRPACSQQ